MLAVGQPAPAFSLRDSNGEPVALTDHRGQWVIFWWYPEANSSGCSIQAGALEQSLGSLNEAGIIVLGASFNTIKENDDFACDKSLSLTLLADPEREVGAQYEVLRDPTDRHPTKPHRHTYVIDPEGLIAHAEDANTVPLTTYGEHLLRTVTELQSARSAER